MNERCRRLNLLAVFTVLVGCSTHSEVYEDERHFTERLQREVRDGLTVEAAALSLEESTQVFGVPLNNIGVQPVWVRIQNSNPHSYWLFPLAIDREYFPAYEVAWRMANFSDLSADTLYRRLEESRISTFVRELAVTSGFVYTHADEGMKAFTIELHGGDQTRIFPFVTPVPGLPSDYFDLNPDDIYPQERFTELNEWEFRHWLETLTCCTVNAEGNSGDPLNIIFVGSLDEVRAALISRHWDVTAPVTGASLWRMMTAFMFGSRYRYAPVSPLYLFGREHDLAFQKARAVIDERNHMRLWLAPVTHNGESVWVGQVSRDVGVKLSGRLWPPTTHVIDMDMDDARFYVLQDLLADGRVEQVGYVRGHDMATADLPHRNAEDDPYFTDGLRVVVFLASEPVPVSDVELLPWRLPDNLEPYRKLLDSDPDFWTLLDRPSTPRDGNEPMRSGEG